MLARVLMDNLAGDGFIGEWGLSIWIDHEGRSLLLDTGSSGRFVENAKRMGVALETVQLGVLSHAHYDHANGMDAFFGVNDHARFYLRAGAAERCYGKKGWRYHYNGIRSGLLKQYAGRITYVEGNYALFPGAWLIPHSTPELGRIAARSGLYVRRGLRMSPDDFSHEQSLVLETDRGLVVFSSCSHAGPDNIVAEVRAALPGRRIYALIGGLHLYKLTDDEVRALAGRILETGVERIYTGHCTGERGYAVLREVLGEGVQQLYTGMEIEV